MKAKHKITIENDLETNRIRVMIGAGPDRIVDGFMNREDAHKLDDILNSKLEYQEKIDAIRQLTTAADSYKEATYERI